MSFQSAAYNAIYWPRKINGELFTFPSAGWSAPIAPIAPIAHVANCWRKHFHDGFGCSLPKSFGRFFVRVFFSPIFVFFYLIHFFIFFSLLATHAIKIVTAKAQIN